METLTRLTLLVDYLVMVVSVWMAMYIVGRGYPNRLAPRAIIMLLAIAFYSYDAFVGVLGPVGANQGVRLLTVMIGLVAGFHFVHSMLPSKNQKETLWIQYLVTLGGLVGSIIFLRAQDPGVGSRLLVENTVFDSPYLVVGIIQVLIALAMFYGLWIIIRERTWPNNRSLVISLVLGISTIGYGLLAAILQRPLPRLVSALLILGAITFLGYSVAKYQTLIERRISLRDLPITALSLFGVTAIYVISSWQNGFSLQQIALLSVMVIVTHSLFDLSQQVLYRVFYQQEREYLQRIRTLARTESGEISLEDSLRKGLAIVCYNLQASGGFIAVKNSEGYRVLASYHSLPNDSQLDSAEVTVENVAEPKGILAERIVCLAPAYAGADQIAVLGLGKRSNRQEYSDADLFWLEDVADQIGAIVSSHSSMGEGKAPARRSSNTRDVFEIDMQLWKPAPKTDPELVKLVEDGFRNLYDYMVLGNSPLSEILNAEGDTHIEMGKSVKEILIRTLASLRPASEEPPEPLPREWHSYTILHDAYVEDVPDRDIMGKLYISEGTFYRTRRKALRGVTRAIAETLAKSA